MLPLEIQVAEGPRVNRRQNNKAPCPGGNGTTIGTVQQFTVLCNTEIDGSVLDSRQDASDFAACVDICSSFHPKCDGASFDGSRCDLMANLRPENQRRSRRSESAIATFPGASSNCATLSGTQQVLSASFTTMCGFIIDGSDISQNYAPTFQDCLGQCASTSGCAALSFDPSQQLGFKNCYLKTMPTNPASVAADRRTDSAMLAAAAAQNPSAGSSGAASPPANPGVSTIPVPSPSGGGGGAVFFTPPGGNTAAAPPPAATSISPNSPNPASTTDLVATLPASSTLGGSLPFSFPLPSTTPVSSPETIPDPAGGSGSGNDAPSSMAWVAAPVVGSVAAIALIAVSFVLLKRRRRGNNNNNSSEKPAISRPSPLSSLFTAWLPGRWSTGGASSSSSSFSSPMREADLGSRGSGGGGGGSRRGRKMGNFSEVESVQRDSGGGGRRESVRGSVVGFMTGRPMGMERLEDIEEGEAGREGAGGARAELRRSFNGLGQNKWSQ